MTKPKILLDENIGVIVANFLRNQNYDVFSVLESIPGTEDKKVLKISTKEDRIFITLDRDIGKLVYFYSFKHVGVIYLRLKKETPKNILKFLIPVLTKYGYRLKGKFVTLSEGKIRIK